MTAATDDPRVTVLLTFDFDAVALWLSSMGTRAPGSLSRGEFGARVGAPRVLELLGDLGVRATWFVPGHTVETFPETCAEIVDAGHELGHHGYAHEPLEGLDRSTERSHLERGIDALVQLTGVRPLGYRSPSWNHTDHTPGLLEEHGFEYDSSLMAHDFRLYWLRTGDRHEVSAPSRFGTPTGVVEVPVSWYLDDFPPFTFTWEPSRWGYGSTRDIARDWQAHVDHALEKVPHGVVTLTMHPQVVGRVHVLRMVEEFLGDLVGRPGVAFETVTQVVRRHRDQGLVLRLT